MITHPIEGDELLLKDRSLWIIKGCYHPGRGYVAIPRMINGKKIKTYREQLNYVKRYYLHYLKGIPQIGLQTPVVPSEDVMKYLSATETPIINEKRLTFLALKLKEIIQDNCMTECGLTGSLLGNYAGGGSDIDLVCLDSSHFPECLKVLRAEGLLHPMSTEDFLKEYPEVKEIFRKELHQELVRLKLTQGLFKGVKYTLKIINCVREKKFLGPYIYALESNILIKLLSTDYRSPSIYKAQILRPSTCVKKAYLLTHRVRLTELPENSLVKGKGLILYKGMNSSIISFDRYPSTIDYIITP